MLRFLLKMMLLLCMSFTLATLLMSGIGKTAPEISNIAFFTQDLHSSAYWHLDMWRGVAFKTDYTGRLVADYSDNPADHVLLLDSGSDFTDISLLNPENQQFSFLGTYWTRHNRLSMAGDNLFLMDYVNQWTRIYIPTAEMTVFGEYPNLQQLRVSPDGQWLAGEVTPKMLFINMLDNRSYELRDACCVQWSPDSQWFLVSGAVTAGINVFSSADGTIHPSFPQYLSATSPRWSADSQAIYFHLNGEGLSRIALNTNETYEYPNQADDFELECLSPNERYVLSWDFQTTNYYVNLALEDLQTGERIWWLPRRNFSGLPQCLWSDDSRYLVFYSTVVRNGLQAKRFFFIDTLAQVSWNLELENLSFEPIYLHLAE